MSTDKFQPLNPWLYYALVRQMGNVDVVRPGLEMTTHSVTSSVYGNSNKIDFWGETYVVRCPICRDWKPRLYINYKWGVEDTAGRRPLHWLVCFNDQCFRGEKALNRMALFDRLQSFGRKYRPSYADLRQGEVRHEELEEVSPPGRIVPLHELPPRHVARWYAISRFFDPDELSRTYGVGFCESSLKPIMVGRLYIPVIFEGKLVGYQGRALGDEVPKYYTMTGFRKSLALYNWDQAKEQSKFLVVFEGVTNVWSFGPESVAVFGNTISDVQWRMIASHPAHTIVLLLDNDPNSSAHIEKVVMEASFRGLSDRVLPVRLPVGFDAADFSRSFVLGQIRNAVCQSQQMSEKGKQLVLN